jgi:hypothetical protein
MPARARSSIFASVVGAAALVASSCSSSKDTSPTLTGDALRDPNNCLPCHSDHFKQWSGSMHAYAAEDPVFLAMNKRMLRETGGATASFCVGCHAPVALRLGLTKDGSNLADLPSWARGVTCYFCHTVDSVGGDANNPLHAADDGVLRGGIADPISAMPHRGAYSKLHDREIQDSAPLCGACHDVVSPHGAHIERTFDEWKNSLYAKPGQLACGKCHMDGTDGPAASVDGAPTRKLHDHSIAAVDTALTPFFGTDDQKQRVQGLLDNSTLLTKLCVQQTQLGFIASVTLDDAFAGHKFPSGAAQDRRVWVELEAFKNGASIFATGQVADGRSAAALASTDPNMWLLRDTMFDDSGKETHLFWQAARVDSQQLPPAVTNDPLDPAFTHSVTRTFTLPSAPDRVTMRVRMRPLDFDVLDDLVQSGDLDPAVPAKIPTYDLASGKKEWTPDGGGFRCVN